MKDEEAVLVKLIDRLLLQILGEYSFDDFNHGDGAFELLVERSCGLVLLGLVVCLVVLQNGGEVVENVGEKALIVEFMMQRARDEIGEGVEEGGEVGVEDEVLEAFAEDDGPLRARDEGVFGERVKVLEVRSSSELLVDELADEPVEGFEQVLVLSVGLIDLNLVK